MHFSRALKGLLSLAGLRNTDLAQYLNYDPSYISKWLSGRSSPPGSRSEMVIGRCADLITGRVAQKGCYDKLAEYLLLKEYESTPTWAQAAIIKFLWESWQRDQSQSGGIPTPSEQHVRCVYTYQEAMEQAYMMIYWAMVVSKEPLHFYTTQNMLFLNESEELRKNMRMLARFGGDFCIHIGLRMDEIERMNRTNNKDLWQMFDYIFRLVMLDINLYDCDEPWNRRAFLLCPGYFMIIREVLSKDDHIFFIIENKAAVRKYERSIYRAFTRPMTKYFKGPRVELVETLRQDARKSYYLCSQLNGLLLFEADKGRIAHRVTAEQARDLEEVHDAFVKLTRENGMRMIFTERSILRFLENGRINLGQEVVVLDTQDRLRYLLQLLEFYSLRRMELFFISSTAAPYVSELVTQNFLGNDRQASVEKFVLDKDGKRRTYMQRIEPSEFARAFGHYLLTIPANHSYIYPVGASMLEEMRRLLRGGKFVPEAFDALVMSENTRTLAPEFLEKFANAARQLLDTRDSRRLSRSLGAKS